jgi:ribonucleotide monophosphatase NagD (HAD superfamily)
MQHAIMIGDDIETDVGGAQAFGIRGVLVKTGKYREDAVARSAVRPEAVLDSIADLQRWL